MPDEELRKQILGSSYPGFNFGPDRNKRADVRIDNDGISLVIVDGLEICERLPMAKGEIKYLIKRLLEVL